jgi:CRISPR-associated endonuclease/helicase Cas3
MAEISSGELKVAFCRVLGGKEPYEHQLKFGEAVLSEQGKNIILSAGTGSGKTEAALVPALLTGKRVFLVYPTKALLQDQRVRVEEVSKKVLGYSPKIVVDTGDEEDPTGYSADIILTNLDKFIYRMFGYGRRRWGYVYPYRLMHDDRESLLVFDEAHAYEEIIFSHFWFVLNKLTYERRVQTLLLSATLPESFVNLLRDEAREGFPRPADEAPFFSLVEDSERRNGRQFYRGAVSQQEALAKAADLFAEGRRVAIIFRRILGKGGLQEAWENLRGRLGEQMACVEDGRLVGSVLAYHGGQLPGYRKRVLDRLLALDKNKEPYLLLTTHAMEVGVDISAEVMFCGAGKEGFPLRPDGFVQQIGRCARRSGEEGDVYLVVEEGGEAPKFAELLEEVAEISPETKRRINRMNEPPSIEGAEGSVEYLHDEALYRYVYDYVPENAELWERGTLVTRDWEPSIELVFTREQDGETLIGGVSEWRFWRGEQVKESLSVTVRQAANLAQFSAWVFTGQDEDNDALIRVALGGERKRTLGEALGQLGYPIGPDANRYFFQDARQVPLMLLMPEAIRRDRFGDENLGMAMYPADAKEVYSGNPNISRYEITLQKKNPSTYLTLRWEEPRREEE